MFNINNELTDILLLSELLMILPHSLAMLSWAKQKLDIGFMLLSFIFFVSVWKNIQVICKKCLQIIAWLCKKTMIQGEKLLCSLYYTNNSQSRCFEKSSHTLYLMERCWVKGPQKKTCIVATPLRHKGWWIFLYNHFHLMNACNVHIDIIPIKHTSWYHIQHVFRYYQQFLHLVVQNWWKLCTLGSCIEFGYPWN